VSQIYHDGIILLPAQLIAALHNARGSAEKFVEN